MLSSRVADMNKNALRLALLSTTLAVASCSSGPPPKLYLLEPVSDLATEVTPPAIDTIGLGKVSLPDYASDNSIATRIEGVQIGIDDRQRWAERPADALSRLFADRLSQMADATVLSEPWPRGFDPDYRVEIQFDKLLREASGGVEMSGHVNLISGDGRRVLGVMPFRQTQFSQSDELPAFFKAVAAGVNEIARTITTTLSELTLEDA